MVAARFTFSCGKLGFEGRSAHAPTGILEAAGLFGPRPLDALADCCLRLLEKVAPHVPRGDRSAATPPAPKRGLDDHDSEVARALLRGKHGVGDDDRSVSPTDVTSDIYAAA